MCVCDTCATVARRGTSANFHNSAGGISQRSSIFLFFFLTIFPPTKMLGSFSFVSDISGATAAQDNTHTHRYGIDHLPSLPPPCIYIHISKAVLFTHRKVHQRATAPTPQESIKTMEGGNEFFFSFLWGGSLFFVCREIVCGWGRERKGQKV